MTQSAESGRSELALRVITALVLIAIVLPPIWIGGWLFTLMCAALSLILFYEWWLMIGNERGGSRPTGWLLFGIPYSVIPVLLLPLIRDNAEPSGLFLVLFLFVVVALTDVCAYFAGRSIGGPKLLPSVSPKKTRSGAMGGLIGATIGGALLAVAFGELTATTGAVMAAILSVFSQVGDLAESWMKRKFNVKDSSNLLPGHGGFLDRVDGLIVAAFPLVLYVLFTANGS